MHPEPRSSDRQACPRNVRRDVGRGAAPASLLARRGLAALALLAPATAAAVAEPPPRSNLQSVGEVAAAERRSPAIGLVTARAPDVLREQLGLDRGAGLVVEAVAVGSHAERAGLKRHDVLVSLDDQLLVLPEQLATLVAASSPDAGLVIEVRRGGKALRVSLGRGPDADPPGVPTPPGPPPAPVTAPPPAASSAAEPASLPPSTEAVPMAEAGSGPAPGPLPVATAPPVDFVPPPGARRLGPNAVVIDNRDYWLKVYRDTETCLMVRDARGWLLFNGPIVTPQQRSLIPRRVRDRVLQMETMLDAVAVRTSPPQAPPARTEPPVATAPVVAPNPAQAVPTEPVAEIGSLDVAPIEIR